jgi:colanic acid/amylovoran biosynthesis glycosyltransferase
MKILFVCHRLITFILNEVVELQRLGNDVSMLSVHRDPAIYNKIVIPMLDKHGLNDKLFIDFTSRNSGKKLIFNMLRALAKDILRNPVRTIKCVYTLPRIYDKIGNGFKCYLETRSLLNEKFDVIHSPFSTPDNLQRVYYLSQILNIPYTLSFRAHDLHVIDDFNKSLTQKNIIHNAASIFTISLYNQSILEKRIEVAENIKIIHGAVDVDFFTPDHIVKQKNRMVSICRFHEQKGIIYLLQACKILNERKVFFECHLIGEGPEEENYKAFINKHDIPNVTIINFINRDGVKAALEKSELFVLPCVVLKDGTCDILPNSLKEAMAMELPIVTSDISGIRELVDDQESGILVPEKDPVAIADKIELLFENRELMKNMGLKAREKIVQDFNIKTEALKLNAIIESAALSK